MFGVCARPWVWAQWLRSNKRPPFLFLQLAETNTAKFRSVVMAHTVISVKLPPNIDPTKARLAYGDRALPKLVSMITCISKYLRSKVRFCQSRLSWMLSVYRTESITFTSYSVWKLQFEDTGRQHFQTRVSNIRKLSFSCQNSSVFRAWNIDFTFKKYKTVKTYIYQKAHISVIPIRNQCLKICQIIMVDRNRAA